MEPFPRAALAFSWGISVRWRTMSDDLWSVPMQDLILNAAGRAAHYRRQAAELREMAVRAGTDPLASDFLDLAVKYETLAASVTE
jgi:hypothetical protein